MIKVNLNCPVCGIPITAGSLDRHLEKVHELTGTVTLRLNPTNPYAHEPEPDGEHEPETEPETEPEHEPETEPEHEPEE